MWPRSDSERQRPMQTDQGAALILVVHHDPETRRLTGNCTNMMHLTPLSAASGLEAVSLAMQYPITAMVVAEEMPGLSGSQTVQLVRRRVAGAGLPALVLGGEQAAEGTINLAGPITSKRFCKAMKQLLRTQS